MIAAAAAAETFPVPIEGVGPGTTSFAGAIIGAAGSRLGAAAAGSAGGLAILIAHTRRRHGPLRRTYNVFLYCAAGGAAGAAASALPPRYRYGFAASAAFYVTDVGLLALVLAANANAGVLQTLWGSLRSTFLAWLAMMSVTVALVALWKEGWIVFSLGPPLLLLSVLQHREQRARVAARELDRAKDEMIATTSHELRTPIASVYGAARTLEAHPELPDATQVELRKVILTQSQRLASLIDDVLWAARIGRALVDNSSRVCYARPAVEEVLAAERTAGELESRLLVGDLTGDPFWADAEHLRRILMNLVENALHYSDGRVWVSAATASRGVCLIVDDEGSGIDPADRERVFDRFVRLDPAMQRFAGGTGLGLYICRALAEAMSGRLYATDSPHGGARFCLELPPPAAPPTAR